MLHNFHICSKCTCKSCFCILFDYYSILQAHGKYRWPASRHQRGPLASYPMTITNTLPQPPPTCGVDIVSRYNYPYVDIQLTEKRVWMEVDGIPCHWQWVWREESIYLYTSCRACYSVVPASCRATDCAPPALASLTHARGETRQLCEITPTRDANSYFQPSSPVKETISTYNWLKYEALSESCWHWFAPLIPMSTPSIVRATHRWRKLWRQIRFRLACCNAS